MPIEGMRDPGGKVSRRLVNITLDNLDDLPPRCRACVFWELDPIGGARAAPAGGTRRGKENMGPGRLRPVRAAALRTAIGSLSYQPGQWRCGAADDCAHTYRIRRWRAGPHACA